MKKLKVIVLILILLLATDLCSQSCILAQDKVNTEDRIIGLTFKALAKAFVAIVDINKLKKSNIDKMMKMKEDKFNSKYAKVYEVIKDLPSELKAGYAVTEHMTKEQAIRNIKSLDKKKIYAMIDSIPDVIIAREFRQYLSKKKQEIQKNNVVGQINRFWAKMMEKVNISVKNKRVGLNNTAGF